MKRRTGLIGLLAVMLIVSGCLSQSTERPRENSVTAAELQTMLRGDNPPRVIYTGSLLEWRDAHLPLSRCVPCDDPEGTLHFLEGDRRTQRVLYGNGPLSRETCPVLAELNRGAKQPLVYVLSGGLKAWKQGGFATVSEERIPRLPVPGISKDTLKTYNQMAKKPLLLDIRSDVAVRSRPIPGALHIPMTRLHEHYGDIPLDRQVVVVDEDGTRSLLAAGYLLRKGISVTARLRGGCKTLFPARAEGGNR
ncbi:MAG TPA: rhodanese-like domain-containing protein [Syntrophales bacterium]|nr:rhodanese-like domain-containing protein [Syntrophales bacterium]HQA82451.1 rhodanese-like domain-containing protein [Syntrophales bacterium]